MTLQELQKQALQLSISDRWQLVQALLESLQRETPSVSKKGNLSRLRGIAKTTEMTLKHWELDKNSHPHEESYLKVDCSKAHTKLGWMPKLDVKTTLSWIVDWTKAFQAGDDMRRYTQE